MAKSVKLGTVFNPDHCHCYNSIHVSPLFSLDLLWLPVYVTKVPSLAHDNHAMNVFPNTISLDASTVVVACIMCE